MNILEYIWEPGVFELALSREAPGVEPRAARDQSRGLVPGGNLAFEASPDVEPAKRIGELLQDTLVKKPSLKSLPTT